MFSIHIKLALRNLLRFKSYTILNVVGLSIGLALAIFSILYVRYQFGYDKIHANRDRMYKLISFAKQADNKSYNNPNNSALLGDALKQQYSDIESFNRFKYTFLHIKKDNNSIGESGIFADENFFRFYDFPLKTGSSETMLNEPDAIVISGSLASKLFGDKPAVNQTISALLDDQVCVFKVTGVFEDVEHSYIDFDFVLSFKNFIAKNQWANDWNANGCEMMMLLKPGTDIGFLNNSIKKFLAKNYKEDSKDLYLAPLSELNLYYYMNGERHMNRLLIVLVMCVICGLILFISAFNFVNMAIATSIKRNREAGIKRIMGASKRSIMFQFLIEAVTICLMALFFAFILLETFLPLYNRIDGVNLRVEYGNFIEMLAFIGFASLVGVAAALYPSLLLGATSPLKILRGTGDKSKKVSVSRQGLIVFQFIITIILFVGLIVMKEQSVFINSKDIGLDRNNVLLFETSSSILKHREAFLSEINSLPEVSSAGWSSQNPILAHHLTNEVEWSGKQPNEVMDFWIINTDTSFFNTTKIRLNSGRFFSGVNASDSGAYVLNDEAVRVMHLKEPVGKIISVNRRKGVVVGVVNNFNAIQLMGPYVPVILSNRPQEAGMVILRFTGDREALKPKLKTIYERYESYIPFNPLLLEDSFNQINQFASNAASVLSMLGLLAMFLSCMGLFGLASFNIESRTKEIGIRKSNGASTIAILKMFLKSYSKWIFIASCIALPISFLAWNTLLGVFFAFRIPFPFWSLLVTPIVVVLIAWSTIIWQSWKAASKNPVEALRYE